MIQVTSTEAIEHNVTLANGRLSLTLLMSEGAPIAFSLVEPPLMLAGEAVSASPEPRKFYLEGQDALTQGDDWVGSSSLSRTAFDTKLRYALRFVVSA